MFGKSVYQIGAAINRQSRKTLEEHATDLHKAIIRAVAAHGSPNTFGYTELHKLYQAPKPEAIRRVVKKEALHIPGVTFEKGRVIVAGEKHLPL